MRQYWQVAAGNVTSNRSYSHLFLKHGLAFVGGDKQVKLADQVKLGDVVILKSGMGQILAAGTVVERKGKIGGTDDKAWLRDIEGWDLRRYLFVDWFQAPKGIDTKGLTKDTLSKSKVEEHQTIADTLLQGTALKVSPEPKKAASLSNEDVVADLVAKSGEVRADALTAILDKIQELDHKDCDTAKTWIANETRDNLVMPLLRALGWQPEDIRDQIRGTGLSHLICCYESTAANDVKVIDCRKFSDTVDITPEQAAQVGDRFRSTPVLVVTNGVAIKLYRRLDRLSFSTEATGYANLAKPTEDCNYLPELHGALTVLRYLVKKEALALVAT